MSRFGHVHLEAAGDTDVEAAAVFWGVNAAEPDENEIQTTFSMRSQDSASGSYEFPPAVGGYLWLALPVAMGAVAAFYADQFPVVFIRSDITLVIEGQQVDYYLYRSPETSAADPGLTLTVP